MVACISINTCEDNIRKNVSYAFKFIIKISSFFNFLPSRLLIFFLRGLLIFVFQLSICFHNSKKMLYPHLTHCYTYLIFPSGKFAMLSAGNPCNYFLEMHKVVIIIAITYAKLLTSFLYNKDAKTLIGTMYLYPTPCC